MSGRNARQLLPLDAVDLEVARLYMDAVEQDLDHLKGRVRAIRSIIEQIQDRNPPRKGDE